MRYSSQGVNFDQALRQRPLRELLGRKGEAGAAFWRANSRKRTGFNSSAVRTFLTWRDGKPVVVIHAWGHYARYREHGTRFNAPERVMRRSVSTIRRQR